MQNNINKELEKAVHYERNLEKVKALLSAGANVNLRVKWNVDTLLHISSKVEITKELLLHGAQVDARNMYSETPLHSAITMWRSVELVRVLLKHGADVNATNRKGNTALHHAIRQSNRNLEVVKELLKYGADINIRNRWPYEDHSSSLDSAIGDLPCAQLLIKYTLIRNLNKDYGKIINLSPYKKSNDYYSKLSSYLDSCVCEVLQMETDEIKDGLPLYEFVKNNCNIRKLCNNQLSVRLANIDYCVRYPIYNDIILDKIKPFLERADLLNKLSKIQFYTKLDTVNQDDKGKKMMLDYDSTYNITEYLSNDNLFNFIVAFDDSNKRAILPLSSLNNIVEPDTRLHETSTSNDTKRVKLE